MELIVIALWIWSIVHVGMDARKWGLNPAGWVVGCILLWIVFFPAYFIARRNRRDQRPNVESPATELAKLADLHRQGELDDDEFEQAKASLLPRPLVSKKAQRTQ